MPLLGYDLAWMEAHLLAGHGIPLFGFLEVFLCSLPVPTALAQGSSSGLHCCFVWREAIVPPWRLDRSVVLQLRAMGCSIFDLESCDRP